MSQNEETTSTTSSEEVKSQGEIPTNPEQTQNVIALMQQLFHQYNQQYSLIQQDNRQYHQHLTTIYNLPEQSYVSCDDKGSNKGFHKLKSTTRKQYHSKYDVDLSNFDISPEGFPEIYSEMYRIDFYQGMFIPNDNNYHPKKQEIKLSTTDRAVTIDQLVSDIQNNRFLSVIGYPGSGKTTLSKRLARRLCRSEDVLVLRKVFMDMTDCNKQLTLKEFLLGDCNYSLNDDEKNSLFEWIKSNPEKCFIILDGFDQVGWNLKENVKEFNYNTPLHYWELLSNLCLGRFLQHCHLVFTSRPHAMLDVSEVCRPKRTYFIHDLTPENMKALFDALINDQHKSEILWKKFTVKTFYLKSMCNNPLMLQLYLRASMSSLHETADLTTMTRIFHTLLLNFKTSGHALSISDEIVTKLSQIAYKATKKGTVLITVEDLAKEDLSSQDIQDLVVTLLAANREYALLEGQQRFYFSHQTFQEYFSALYICREMSLPDFTCFVQNNLLEDHWVVVVQFLSGLLLDSFINNDLSCYSSTIKQHPSDESTSSLTPSPYSSSEIALSQKLQKKKRFISELYKKTKEVAANHKDHRSIVAISKILRENNDEEVIETAGSHFDGGRIWMYDSDTPNDFHAVTSFLKSMSTRVEFLSLSRCYMTSNQLRPWIEAVKSMPGSIVWLNLQRNLLSSIDDVIDVLGKVEEKVEMRLCFNDGDGRWRSANMEERAKLQKALDELKNNKLKVWVDEDDYNRIYFTYNDSDD